MMTYTIGQELQDLKSVPNSYNKELIEQWILSQSKENLESNPIYKLAWMGVVAQYELYIKNTYCKKNHDVLTKILEINKEL